MCVCVCLYIYILYIYEWCWSEWFLYVKVFILSPFLSTDCLKHIHFWLFLHIPGFTKSYASHMDVKNIHFYPPVKHPGPFYLRLLLRFIRGFSRILQILRHQHTSYCASMFSIILYCTVIYCTVLHWTVQYYTVLYHTVIYCTVL